MLRSLHMLVLALATTLGIASSATAITSETALRANRDFPAHRVTDFGEQAREAHQQNALEYGERASDASHAARALPQIAKASNREMLGQAIAHVKELSGTAAQKADLFQQLGSQVSKLSGGSWTAARGVGTEGSHVFLGGAGEALVINPAGQVFRGSLQTGGVGLAGPGQYVLDFAKLTGL